MPVKKPHLFSCMVALAASAPLAWGQTLSREECEAHIASQLEKMEAGVSAGPYRADWDSLKEHHLDRQLVLHHRSEDQAGGRGAPRLH